MTDIKSWVFSFPFSLFSNQFSSVAQLCPILSDPMDCSTPGFPVHHQLPELAQTHAHQVSDAIYLILCCPLLLLPSILPSIRVFSSESVLHIKWPKYWSFSFRISPSNEYSGLISLRIGWFDLLVKDTLKIKTTTKFESYCVPGTVLKSLYSFCVFSARTYASPLRALRLVRSVGK